jgi:ATP-dependent DNA helicase 2 subunit 2
VQQLGDTLFDSPRLGGDVFSAVSFATGQLNDHCGKKKYNKRIFLFTAGMGETDFDNHDIRTLAGRLEEADIKLNLIPIDFMTSYSAEEN